MKFTLLTFSLAAGLLLFAQAADAHHGWVDFDEKAEVTVQGTVTAFYFFNPHCVLEFDVKDDSGHLVKWQGEFASKGELSRKGWTAASIESGQKLTLTGHPAKDGTRAIHVVKIVMSTGEVKLGGEKEDSR
jgi:Family of unknown function (DUF6152)